MTSTLLIIPADKKRKGIGYCMYDVNTGKYYAVQRDKCTKEQLDLISKSCGTLLYIHKKYKVLGLLKDISGHTKPKLIFMKESDIDNNDIILNYKEKNNVIDISDKEVDFFNNKNKEFNKFYNVYYISYNANGKKITNRNSVEFIESLNTNTIKNKPITEQPKQPPETQETPPENIKVAEEIGDKDSLHSLYKRVLQLMKKNDTITIPIEIYSKFITTIRKNLYINISCTKYNSITDIKFDKSSDEFILALTEYNEEIKEVRITLLKPFNSERVSDDAVVDYEISYMSWRKRNSFHNN